MEEEMVPTQKNLVLTPDQAQRVMDALPCAVVVLEKPDGRITYVNQRARLLYGMDPRGLALAEHPEIGLLKLDGTPYVPGEMPASRSLLYGEEVRGEELILARPDGSRVTVSASSAPITGARGEVTAVIGVFDDVTEARQLEQELQLKEQAMETAAFGMGMTDLQGRVTYANPALLRMLGYDSSDGVLGENATGFWLDGDEARAARRTVLEQGAWQGEINGRRKDGSTVPVLVASSLVTDSAGSALAIIASFIDISRRRDMEAELARHREHLEEMVEERTRQLLESRRELRKREVDFRALIESNADAMVVMDESGRLRFFNPAAPALLGEIQVGQSLGFPVTSGVTEVEIVGGGSGNTIAEMRVVEIQWEGEPAFLATLRDVTSLRRAAERIRTLSRRLIEAQEKERRKIGHELHDEVGGALTGIKLALNRAAKKLGKRAQRELSEVEALLDDTMDLVSTLSHAMRPDVLDEFGLVEALKWYFARYTRQTGIKVDFRQTGLAGCCPDTVETAAYRIVQESLTNVARYAGVDSVTVTVRGDSDKLHIQVEDRGRGFDPREMDGSSSGVIGMQDRAFLAGGELVVDSSPGRGTCVTCELPLAGG